MTSSKSISTVMKSRVSLRTLAVLACLAAAVVALDVLFPVFARSNPQAVADLSAVDTGQDQGVSHPYGRIDEKADEAVSNAPDVYCVNPATCIVDQSYAGDDADGTWQSPFRKFRYGIAEAQRWGKDLGVTATVIISPGNYAAVGVYTYPTRLEAPAGGVVLESFPELTGLADPQDCPWGSRDCNPCVENVVESFQRLGTYGDTMGFNLGDHPEPQFELDLYDRMSLPDIEPHKHWQGIQRIMAGDGRYLVLTRDDIVDEGGEGWSGFVVAHLGTRDSGPGAEGGRFRSNRLRWGVDVDATPPDDADTVVQNGTVFIDPEEEHPGGIQVMGDFLAVGTGGLLHFYDLSDPLAPVNVGPYDPASWDQVGPVIKRDPKSGSSTSLAQLQDGRYLLVVSSSDAVPLDFYVSDEPYTLRQPDPYVRFSNFDRWDEPLPFPPGPTDPYWDAFQSLNLVTECGTGDLYLIGTGNDGPLTTISLCFPFVGCKVLKEFWIPWETDQAVLYEVIDPVADDDDVSLEYIGFTTFDCQRDWSRGNLRNSCNFDAAAGIYVDPNHQLFIYSTEHANNGPEGGIPEEESIKFTEFRPVPHGSCTDIGDAWVELYEEEDFGGRSLMIDFVDRHLENYKDYGQVEDFAGEASSIRWCLPPGWAYSLYELENWGGKQLRLYGTGKMRDISRLKDLGCGFNNRISSSLYSEDPPVVSEVDPIFGSTLVYNPPDMPDVSVIVQIPPVPPQDISEVMYTPDFPSVLRIPPWGYAGLAFNLEAQVVSRSPQVESALPKPFTITIHYTGPQVTRMNEDSLGLYYWHTPTSQWLDAATTCDPDSTYVRSPDENWLAVPICHTGEFALFGEVTSTELASIVYPESGGSVSASPAPDRDGGTLFTRGTVVTLTAHPNTGYSFANWSGDASGSTNPIAVTMDADKSVTANFQLRVLFDEAHGERNTLDWERAQEIEPEYPEWVYFGALVEALEDEFIFERNPDAELTTELLQDYSLLVLSAPDQPLSEPEVSAVKQFVDHGGGLVMLGDCGLDHPGNAFSLDYGITFDSHCLFAPAPESEGDFAVTRIDSHLVVIGVHSMVTNWGGSLTTAGQAVPLAWTGDEAWQDVNWNDRYDPGDDAIGPFTVAATYDAGHGRVAAVSDNGFQDDGFEGRSNDAFMRALLRWAAGWLSLEWYDYPNYLPITVRDYNPN